MFLADIFAACLYHGQFEVVAGLAAWSCFIVVVFFDVDIPLQSLALPPSLLAPLPLVPLLLEVPAPEPLFVAAPFVLPPEPEVEFVDVPELVPVFEPDPLLLPDCCANADDARPMDRNDTARTFINMVLLRAVLC